MEIWVLICVIIIIVIAVIALITLYYDDFKYKQITNTYYNLITNHINTINTNK